MRNISHVRVTCLSVASRAYAASVAAGCTMAGDGICQEDATRAPTLADCWPTAGRMVRWARCCQRATSDVPLAAPRIDADGHKIHR